MKNSAYVINTLRREAEELDEKALKSFKGGYYRCASEELFRSKSLRFAADMLENGGDLTAALIDAQPSI